MSRFEMDAATLAQLSRLLDEALEQPPAARDSWIETLGPQFDVLKPQLRDLLSRSGAIETGDFLHTIPKIHANVSLAPESPEKVGAVVGPYRLIRELGAGGMGTVWLAERVDGLIQRKIALKLPHIVTPRRAELAERMAREREILASLDHPNIAKLFDAGLTREGQPYLALEYVEGVPIDRYCLIGRGKGPLSVATRLRLFQQVANAVAYAHGKLVVHRDLKPANVLVTPNGEVRLLDFGIAKLLEDGETKVTQLTQFSGGAFTPDYASPEQVLGEPLTVASDVYSLGVILYELLTGARPYKLTRDSRGALEDAILKTDPPPPSEAAPAELRKALRGDLDTIVLKSLKKNPRERYATVNALAEDVTRHLDRRPLLARPDTAGYRLRKFVARNKLGVAAATVIALALLAGGGVVIQQRNAARAEAEVADNVSRFLEKVLITGAPENSKGVQLSLREAVDRGAESLRSGEISDEVVRSRLQRTVGYVYHRLGDTKLGRPLIEDAVLSARKAGIRGKAALADALVVLGQIQRHADEDAAAETSLREALAIQRRILSPDDARIGATMNDLAILFRTKDPEQALALYRVTYEWAVRYSGAASEGAAQVLMNIGSIQVRMRQYKSARETSQRALPLVRKLFGELDPRYTTVLNNLAMCERELGSYERAIELQQEDIAISTRVQGPDHYEVAASWMNLSRITMRLGDYPTALAQMETALAIFRKHFPEDHQQILSGRNTRAQLLMRLGRAAEARAELASVLLAKPNSRTANLVVLNAQVLEAEFEREAHHVEKSLALLSAVLADPLTSQDIGLNSFARAEQSCALGALAKRAEAEKAFQELQSVIQNSQASPQAGLVSEARFRACSGDAPRATALLQQAIDAGFRDRLMLDDPALREVLPASKPADTRISHEL